MSQAASSAASNSGQNWGSDSFTINNSLAPSTSGGIGSWLMPIVLGVLILGAVLWIKRRKK